MIETPERKHPEPGESATDFVRHPLYGLLWWGLPIALAVLAGALATGPRWPVLAWSLAFAWMGTGCLLNARRCHRRHCYLSGPVMLVGAAILGLMAVGVVPSSSAAINAVLWGAFGLVLLSFVPELVWGRYVGSARSGGLANNG